MGDLQACIRGEKAAWDAFVAEHTGVLHAAVRRILRQHTPTAAAPEVLDVVQECFLRLIKDDFRLLKRYDPARSRLTTWLTIIARSTAIDRLRRRKPPPLSLSQEEIPLAAPPERPTEGGVAELEIPDDLLSARQELVLRMLFDEQMSVRQAARTLRVNAQTIRSTKHKALQKLRRFFHVR